LQRPKAARLLRSPGPWQLSDCPATLNRPLPIIQPAMARTGNDLLTQPAQKPLRYRHVPMWLVWTVVVQYIWWASSGWRATPPDAVCCKPWLNPSSTTHWPCKDTHRMTAQLAQWAQTCRPHQLSGRLFRLAPCFPQWWPLHNPRPRLPHRAPHPQSSPNRQCGLTQPTQMARPTHRCQSTHPSSTAPTEPHNAWR
jgi:hypothetical protein